MMNWNEYGRKRSWPNLRYYLGICLEGLRKVSKNLSYDIRSAGRHLNLGLPKYEAGVLTTNHDVRCVVNVNTTQNGYGILAL
jgi:hypothetical protein